MAKPEAITRRTILAGVMTTIVAGDTVSTADCGARLVDLIRAHEEAFERQEQAYTLLEERTATMVEEVDRSGVKQVPVSVLADGSCLSGYLELGRVSASAIRSEIRETHERLKYIHCGKWSMIVHAEFAAAASEEIEACEARALRALDEAEMNLDALRCSAGSA